MTNYSLGESGMGALVIAQAQIHPMVSCAWKAENKG
jgi:hypothetical protein